MLPEDAIKEQELLKKEVIIIDQLPPVITHVAGVDVAYEKDGDKVIAAVVVLDAVTLKILEVSTHQDKISFPYIPGLFSFREIPPLLQALENISIKPDIIVCDGQGIAHPRRFGLASHLGVVTGIPTIGCGKTKLIGEYVEPELFRGSFSNLIDNGEIIGRVLRTQDSINPLFISIGHKISLETATQWILKLSPNYRLPETTRAADNAVNKALKEIS
ncbi:MAG: deoxyribonuclease V [Cytophagaceae bacterium]|nr:deoxyribonuclease V [Cytophagaceae bacterium]